MLARCLRLSHTGRCQLRPCASAAEPCLARWLHTASSFTALETEDPSDGVAISKSQGSTREHRAAAGNHDRFHLHDTTASTLSLMGALAFPCLYLHGASLFEWTRCYANRVNLASESAATSPSSPANPSRAFGSWTSFGNSCLSCDSSNPPNIPQLRHRFWRSVELG